MNSDLQKLDFSGLQPEQKEFIKSVVAKDCNDQELAFLFYMANTYNLDPFVRELYCIKFDKDSREPAQVFVSYAGFLKVAHRSGLLDGITAEIIRDEHGKATGAIAEVFLKGYAHSFSRPVSMKEYNRGNRIWSNKPETMILKVAIVHALRMAIPLSGLYIEEEFDIPDEPRKMRPKDRKATGAIIDVDQLQREEANATTDVFIPDTDDEVF